MAGYAAALLDELMGRNRDSNPFDISIKRDHWSDDKVCKYFLCGFCPHDLFVNTRADLGKCTKVHDDDFKTSYLTSDKFEKMGYEKDFERCLVSLISDVDRRIRRGEQRLVLNNQHKTTFMTPAASARKQRIEELTESINTLVSEAETLGCQGDVDEAKKVMERCDILKMEKNSLATIQMREQMLTDQEMNKAMEVCGICGAFLVVGDPQQRQDEHIMGKLHMGYAKIRAHLKERNVKISAGESSKSESSSSYKPSPYASIDLASDLSRERPTTAEASSERQRSRSNSRHKKRSRSMERKHRRDSKSHKSAKDHKHRHHRHHHRSHRDRSRSP